MLQYREVIIENVGRMNNKLFFCECRIEFPQWFLSFSLFLIFSFFYWILHHTLFWVPRINRATPHIEVIFVKCVKMIWKAVERTKFSGSTNRSTCLHIHRPFQWLINSNTRAGRMRFVSLYVYACRLVGATHLSCDITTEYHGLIQTAYKS